MKLDMGNALFIREQDSLRISVARNGFIVDTPQGTIELFSFQENHIAVLKLKIDLFLESAKVKQTTAENNLKADVFANRVLDEKVKKLDEDIRMTRVKDELSKLERDLAEGKDKDE